MQSVKPIKRFAVSAGWGKARESSSSHPLLLLPFFTELFSIWAFKRIRKARHYRDRGTRNCLSHRLPLQIHGRYPGSLKFGIQILFNSQLLPLFTFSQKIGNMAPLAHCDHWCLFLQKYFLHASCFFRYCFCYTLKSSLMLLWFLSRTFFWNTITTFLDWIFLNLLR